MDGDKLNFKKCKSTIISLYSETDHLLKKEEKIRDRA